MAATKTAPKPNTKTAASKTPAETKPPKDLSVFKVRHEGHDVAATSIVVAEDDAQAREFIREALEADGHGLSHSKVHLEVKQVSAGDTPSSVALTQAGVLVFDDGRVS